MRTWSQEESAVGRVLRSLGWEVWKIERNHRKRGSRGVFDYVCFKPGRVLLWDSKAGRGQLSPDQEKFAKAAQKGGCEVGWGDADAVRRYHLPKAG